MIRLLNENAGIMDSDDNAILKQYEKQAVHRWNQNRCPLCKSSFEHYDKLLTHLLHSHFKQRLIQSLPTNTDDDVFKCPKCNHESKEMKGFVLHYGLEHKMIQFLSLIHI